jgi:proline iminopeptidase
MPTTVVNGTTIHYQTLGTGPTCLVLHGGLGLDHHLYRPPLAALADRLRLVFYDHRGNGRSGRPALSTITMAQLADDADALAEQLAADRVVVLGHSYGGFVAQELALRHPARVAGLILVGTTPGQLGTGEPPAEPGPPIPTDLAPVFSAEPEGGVPDGEFAAVMRIVLAHQLCRPVSAELAAAVDRTVFDAGAYRHSMRLLASWSSVDRLPGITVPTLLVVGEHDWTCAKPQTLRIAGRLPAAEVAVFTASGHLPFYDEPDRFVAVVTGWLARHRLAGRPSPITA